MENAKSMCISAGAAGTVATITVAIGAGAIAATADAATAGITAIIAGAPISGIGGRIGAVATPAGAIDTNWRKGG